MAAITMVPVAFAIVAPDLGELLLVSLLLMTWVLLSIALNLGAVALIVFVVGVLPMALVFRAAWRRT